MKVMMTGGDDDDDDDDDGDDDDGDGDGDDAAAGSDVSSPPTLPCTATEPPNAARQQLR